MQLKHLYLSWAFYHLSLDIILNVTMGLWSRQWLMDGRHKLRSDQIFFLSSSPFSKVLFSYPLGIFKPYVLSQGPVKMSPFPWILSFLFPSHKCSLFPCKVLSTGTVDLCLPSWLWTSSQQRPGLTHLYPSSVQHRDQYLTYAYPLSDPIDKVMRKKKPAR